MFVLVFANALVRLFLLVLSLVILALQFFLLQFFLLLSVLFVSSTIVAIVVIKLSVFRCDPCVIGLHLIFNIECSISLHSLLNPRFT